MKKSMKKIINYQGEFYYKVSLMIMIFLSFLSDAPAQGNLVPNPSFEDHNNCPPGPNHFYYTEEWFNAGNSPDYFHACGPVVSNGASVPYSFLGYQFAFHGDAHIGILTSTMGWNPNYREYIGVKLIDSLNKGITYYFSMYAVLAFGGGNNLNCGSNNLGILLSTQHYDSTLSLMAPNNYSTATYPVVILDTLNWTKISFTFTADSTYEYLYIGNFYDDQNTDTVKLNNSFSYGTYYFLDSICLSSDPNGCNNVQYVLEVVNSNPLIYPNPFIDDINIKCVPKCFQIDEIHLYDACGREVLNRELTITENYITLSLKDLNSGAYFLKTGRYTTLLIKT